MLLGKRPRPPMKRTTSLTEITFDLSTNEEMIGYQPSDPHNSFKGQQIRQPAGNPVNGHHDGLDQRGDSAFCSLECRQQQMNHDERVEKCSLASKKLEVVSSSASAARSQVTAKGETVAAL
ncbi:hypothetical protein TIFTF001_014479 [Ficus carica]|uniref:FLZ-type domain-containing protein n=1 Tax=Ficus carica TaxID=3494 RepID=A0AA88A3U1_FICCA|nr:hypothetical protein TIFTF001_014479 [Ficus carica]